jgi:DNA-binding NarL/FixJ family response regulator
MAMSSPGRPTMNPRPWRLPWVVSSALGSVMGSVTNTPASTVPTGAGDIEVVAEAATGGEAVDVTARHRPDVVVMDLRMPGLDGAAATAEIRRRHPDVHVLILTTYETDADILAAVGAGATGYLLKDAPLEELYRAVRAAAREETTFGSRVASRVLRQIRGDPNALTRREIEVLELVAAGQRNREIGRALHIGEATVKSHLLHIFSKLGVDDRTHAVTVALERGVLRGRSDLDNARLPRR